MQPPRIIHRFIDLRVTCLLVLAIASSLIPQSGSLSPVNQASNPTASQTVMAPEQAAALAVNTLDATFNGYTLTNPHHHVQFTRQGLTFTPQHSDLNWHWRLTHVGSTAMGAPLAAVQQGAVSPQQAAATTVFYPRGGLTEQYIAHASSVEQQFVIP